MKQFVGLALKTIILETLRKLTGHIVDLLWVYYLSEIIINLFGF